VAAPDLSHEDLALDQVGGHTVAWTAWATTAGSSSHD